MKALKKGGELTISATGTSTSAPLASIHTQVAILENGNFVVSFESTFDGKTHFRVMAPDGTAVSTDVAVAERYSAVNDVIALPGGGFSVFSSNYTGGARIISMQKYDNTGAEVGTATEVLTPTSARGTLPSNLNVDLLKNGNFILTWDIYDDRPGETVARFSTKAQVFGQDGALIGAELNLSGSATFDQRDSEVSASKDGGFVVTWREYGGAVENGNDIFVQKFRPDGTAVSSVKQVNTVSFSDDSDPVVTNLANGKFLVSWWGGFGEDGDNWGSFAQLYNRNGSKSGENIQLNTFTDSQQWAPDVEALPDGGFIAAWQSFGQDGSGGGIFAQRFDARAQMVGEEFQVNTSTGASQWYANIEVADNGSYVVAWQSQHRGGNTWQVMAQQFQAQSFGTAGNNRMRDNIGANWIDGQGGKDRIFGLGGDDKLFGGNGNDLLNGGLGQDRLFGGRGDDRLVGAKGHDLLKGGLGNDVLIGSKGNDRLFGGKGADTFVFKAGVDGKDRIIGFNADQDTIRISNTASVTISHDAGNTLIDYDGAAGSILLNGVVLNEADISFEFV